MGRYGFRVDAVPFRRATRSQAPRVRTRARAHTLERARHLSVEALPLDTAAAPQCHATPVGEWQCGRRGSCVVWQSASTFFPRVDAFAEMTHDVCPQVVTDQHTRMHDDGAHAPRQTELQRICESSLDARALWRRGPRRPRASASASAHIPSLHTRTLLFGQDSVMR